LLQIPFAEIPEEGLALKVDDVSWFPDQEVARRGDLRVEIFLERNGEMVLLRGSINVAILQVCDRCLEEFIRPLQVDFRLVLELATVDDGLEVEIDSHDVGRSEIEVVLVEKPVVDLADLLYQQLILALPQKILCRPDCLGLCEHCGANLNLEKCGCAELSENSPFAALGRLARVKK
jgi:uncharacterized protein